MGQASKRGTFEQRRAWAEARNKAVLSFVQTAPTNKTEADLKLSVAQHIAKHGIQKVASFLERTGQLTIATTKPISH